MKWMASIGLLLLCGVGCKQPVEISVRVSNEPPPYLAPKEMVWIPGGTFYLGATHSNHAEESPAILTQIDGFFMDATEVTNAQFRAFVTATGYVTVAERPLDWEILKKELPDGTPKPEDSLLQGGALVFTPPKHPVSLQDYTAWWSWIIGASWEHPLGPDSSIEGLDNHPVVQIAYEDALAYARWAGKQLPTEAEWEYAAQAGTKNTPFAWGEELTPSGQYLANFFQGDFPYSNSEADGYMGTAPTKSYPPNAFNLYDMIGNVWEWTDDWYRPDTYRLYHSKNLKICRNPLGPEASYDPREPQLPKKVVKGGSYLCSEQYCSRYRPDARMATDINSGQSHLGFRCIIRP